MVITQVSEYAKHNDAISLVIVSAAQAPEVASSRALRAAKEYDLDGKLAIFFSYIYPLFIFYFLIFPPIFVVVVVLMISQMLSWSMNTVEYQASLQAISLLGQLLISNYSMWCTKLVLCQCWDDGLTHKLTLDSRNRIQTVVNF